MRLGCTRLTVGGVPRAPGSGVIGAIFFLFHGGLEGTGLFIIGNYFSFLMWSGAVFSLFSMWYVTSVNIAHRTVFTNFVVMGVVRRCVGDTVATTVVGMAGMFRPFKAEVCPAAPPTVDPVKVPVPTEWYPSQGAVLFVYFPIIPVILGFPCSFIFLAVSAWGELWAAEMRTGIAVERAGTVVGVC